MRGESRSQELLDQSSYGLAVRAHPPLLVDDVALLVELAHHRLQEALRLEIRPQLETVRGQRIEVAGLLAAREGVQSDPALSFDDLGESVGHDIFVRLGQRVLPGLLLLCHLRLVPPRAAPPLQIEGRIDPLDLLRAPLPPPLARP